MKSTTLLMLLVTLAHGESDGDYFPSSESDSEAGDEPRSKHIWRQVSEFEDTALDQATLLLSSSKDIIDNNPLDNLSDLRDIHEFSIDLRNYTDHEAIETSHTEASQEFNDHFDILPGMDTRDFNDTEFYSSEIADETSNDLHELNPELYEVVTSTPEDNESNTYDENELSDDHFDVGSSQDGMDRKYYQLLENIHKKIHQKMNTSESEEEVGEEIEEIHQEENDVMHPLISLRAIKPNSMRLAITPNPQKYDENAMVRLMYKRVPRNKPAHMKHLDDPIIEYIHLYRPDQEHFLSNLPRGKYIVCADYTTVEEITGKKVVLQHNCFETVVDRLDNNSLQGGVVGIIALAILCMVCCMGYAVYHRCIREETSSDEEMISAKH